MKDLVYKKRDVLGLDIGTSNVKYVQLKDKGKLTKLIGYGSFEIPKNIIIEGIISEPEKLAEIIKKELSDPPWGKIEAKRVVAALPDSKLFTRILELPVLSEKDIQEAINLETDQSIPVANSDLYVDWQIVRRLEDKIFVFMAAAPKSIVNSYVQLFELMSMESLALEISLAAVARSVVSPKNRSTPILILDIGGETTNMAVFDNGIQIASSHPFGAETIKKNLSSALGFSQPESEKSLKSGLGKDQRSSEVIKKDLSKIPTEIERMVKYYKEKRADSPVEKIVVSGGLGAMEGLGEYIEEETKIKTETGNPWSNISIYPLKPVPKKDAPMYATAIGLSLRGLEDE